MNIQDLVRSGMSNSDILKEIDKVREQEAKSSLPPEMLLWSCAKPTFLLTLLLPTMSSSLVSPLKKSKIAISRLFSIF